MTEPETIAKGITLHPGDCLDVLAQLAEHSVDSCVTDPPYHLTSIVKRFGAENAAPAKAGKTGAYARASAGFMGKQWDGGDVAFRPETWAAVFRVLKPGGHLIAFSGTRTYHRMACAIEDAGFEVRDQLGWTYGSGFPKSHDVSKGIDQARKDSAEWRKVGSWLRSQREARGFKQKEVAALWPSATGGLTGCVANWELGFSCPKWDQWQQLKGFIGFNDDMDAEVWRLNGRKGTPGNERVDRHVSEPGANSVFQPTQTVINAGTPVLEAAREWAGWGTALKPAWEPVVLARKPLSEGTVAANVLLRGTGAINIDGCRIGDECGRWPANLIHDGSAEVIEAFPQSDIGGGPRAANQTSGSVWGIGGERSSVPGGATYGDTGSAARFFYTAKADQDDRIGSKHPTVKPVDLMQWLVRLVTPAGGLVLDPFAGTGTTGEAAFREGMRAILIEREAEYQDDIRRRMKLALAGPDERRRESIKAKTKDEPQDAGPLFSEWDAMWSHPFVPEKR
jgi:DNA modification methylase